LAKRATRRSSRKSGKSSLGDKPGTLKPPRDSPPPRIHVIRFGSGPIEEFEDVPPTSLRELIRNDRVTWIDVHGLGDVATLEEIGRVFDLHPIELENVVNMPERAKSELYGPHHMVVARVPLGLLDGIATPPQVSIIAGEGFLLSFQERHQGLFDGIRSRIRAGNARITSLGSGYLCYALLDAAVDHYFPVVDDIYDRLDELEDEITQDPRQDLLAPLHELRRALAVIRRVGMPQKEAISAMLRDPSPVLTDEIRSYLRDTFDHMSQVMDRVESARDAAVSLAELYLSQVSFRTNEIMKVLTLMSSMFIPLTFIAGIYGMNFQSMPELDRPWAYPVVLGVMFLVAVGMVVYFRRRGWIGSSRSRRD
jgi:magnesium transporter